MPAIFADFDLDHFWEDSASARRDYQANPPSAEQVAAVERELGYKLPDAYVELMQHQNGGMPLRCNHRAAANSWADDRITITGIFSIGAAKDYSLCGEMGSRFWVDEWGYPPIGVYFADCPTAGHHMVCLDYRECGPQGEPRVVHVDQRRDYKVLEIAPDFESFIRGLEGDEAFTDEG